MSLRSASFCSKKDSFCFICANFMFSNQKRIFNDDLKELYMLYFGFRPDNLNKDYAPEFICNTCEVSLIAWENDKRNLAFGKPAIWTEITNHFSDCYFCCTNTFGFSHKNKKSINYANVNSAQRPIQNCDKYPTPIAHSVLKQRHQNQRLPSRSPSPNKRMRSSLESDYEYEMEMDLSRYEKCYAAPTNFTNARLCDLVRDLGLSKIGACDLTSELVFMALTDPAIRVKQFKNTYYF